MTNAPSFSDFIAEKVGNRNWYTAARRCPAYERRRGHEFIPAKLFRAYASEFKVLFGYCPRSCA